MQLLTKNEYADHNKELLTIPVATNSHALVSSVRIETDYIVKFIGHASRSRHVSNTSNAHYSNS